MIRPNEESPVALCWLSTSWTNRALVGNPGFILIALWMPLLLNETYSVRAVDPSENGSEYGMLDFRFRKIGNMSSHPPRPEAL